ncbi:hypothetical protein [Aquisphaera insulae]|uniref:hypothetical protein n=1 Tax=Aquisphaera insulae TaxID=2712864 RepID=UPI0013EBE3C0|nr:hypothetical protein [Aquisphaera insulae]
MNRIAFDSFSVVAFPGWEDFTETIEADEPPFTLARGDGAGALQFSIALFTNGPVPNPTPDQLYEMVLRFAEARGLDAPAEVVLESSPLRLAAGSFEWGEDFLRIWQVSDGRNFAFVTYTCESGQQGRELGDAERIVRSIRFRDSGGDV